MNKSNLNNSREMLDVEEIAEKDPNGGDAYGERLRAYYNDPGSTIGDITRPELDIISRTSLYADLGSTITDAFRGLNVAGPITGLPLNKEMYGMTLFTRPNMSLINANLKSSRKLATMMTKTNSIGNAVRCYLDPESNTRGIISSGLVNHKSPWINILSNTIQTLSGWPDIVVETYKAPGGIHRETWLMYDGIATTHQEFSLTASFQNIAGDPISYLFDMWLQWGHCVRQNIVVPYLQNIVEKRIDYQTAIWRIVLDENRRKLSKIARTYASVPTNLPMGAAFNFNANEPYNLSNQSINIQFDSVGAVYNDPILYDDFNRLVVYYNSQMHPSVRNRSMVKLSTGEALITNSQEIYFWINKDTLEFERWMPIKAYNDFFNI